VSDPRGYYLMYRGWIEHPALNIGPFDPRSRWVDMIEQAAWRPHRRNIAGKVFELQRGEFTASIRFLATRWGVGKGVVERFIARLKTETMIETRTETGQLIIRICNYDRFQRAPEDAETPSETAAETAAGQQQDSSGTKENTSNSVNAKKGSLFGDDEQKPSRRKPETPFPPDEKFKLQCLALFAERRPDLDARTVFETFRDHAHMNDRRCRDWPAAARMWIKKERDHGQPRRQDRPGGHRAGASIAAAAKLAERSE
jgi:hypothetical protein